MGRYTTYTAWLPASGQSYLIPGLSSSVISISIVQEKETRAQSLVEGYLAKKYQMPMTSNVSLVKTIVEDIATYDIFRWLTTLNRSVQNSEVIKEKYEQSLAILNDITAGKVALFDDLGNYIDERSLEKKYWISTNNRQPTFNLDDPLDWEVSPSRLEEIANDRDSDD